MSRTHSRRWETRRVGRSADEGGRESYYDIPPVHKPHWRWLVVLYFYLGGIAGASYALAAVADQIGGTGGRPIARAGRFIALAALVPCPPLLVLDLARPTRFLNMLRIVKLRSPMSLGSWALLGFGGFAGLSALLEMVGARRAGRLVGLVGAVPATFVAGYTGVLLSTTAVPLWARAHPLLGPLFLTSALSCAGAVISIALRLTGAPSAPLERLERFERVALCAEAVMLAGLHARLGPTIGHPLRSGRLAALHAAGVLGAGIAAPLALGAFGRGGLAALLAAAGGLALRTTIVFAGRASADDPAATFEMTRAPAP